ncbi:serine O-acetyltransferase [Pedobacter sp.]|uniref:serine O-acetyltransferase n=1 Tax=Pedobacter sp. TaxID=1411316 RepID=UPI003BAB93DD
MNDDFLGDLLKKPSAGITLPGNDYIAAWALELLHLLFPENEESKAKNLTELQAKTQKLKDTLKSMLQPSLLPEGNAESITEAFFSALPEVYYILQTDLKAIFEGDPAARSETEVLRTYPGFYAIYFYRVAHQLAILGVSLIPRILTEHAHSKTGIDIHPLAQIGAYFHIDHGTGIVIGETSLLGKNVKIYQGVTLGAMSVSKSLAGNKRHPTVEDNVVIYSGATILGGETVIGHDSVIGGNVWLTESVPPYSTAYHSPVIRLGKSKQTHTNS